MPSDYLQASTFNLDSFFSLIGNFFSYIFSVHFFAFMYVLSTLVIIALITLIMFLLVRMREIRQEDAKLLPPTSNPTVMPTTTSTAAGTGGEAAFMPKQNDTWREIRERLLSDNNSDWKLAIIEADIYLDRVLDDKGFHGDTTSDKLKQVTPDKLPSIQIAWEAHKIRNRIAHDGAAFVLTMPESRRLLSYYEIVFADLGVI